MHRKLPSTHLLTTMGQRGACTKHPPPSRSQPGDRLQRVHTIYSLGNVLFTIANTHTHHRHTDTCTQTHYTCTTDTHTHQTHTHTHTHNTCTHTHNTCTQTHTNTHNTCIHTHARTHTETHTTCTLSRITFCLGVETSCIHEQLAQTVALCS